MHDLIEKKFVVVAGSSVLMIYKGMRGTIIDAQDMGFDYSHTTRVTLAFPSRRVCVYTRRSPVDGPLRLNDGGSNSIRIRLQ